MNRFHKKKKLEILEAVQFTGDNLQEVKEWAGENILCTEKEIAIPTSAGIIVVDVGDYIIKKSDGTFCRISQL